MGVWTDRMLPRVIDKACGVAEITPLRAAACAGLEGRVLEIGFGSGLNLPHLPEGVSAVAAVEPSEVAWRMAGDRLRVVGVPVERTGLDGQSLLEPDASCDSALVTFTLCTIPDPVRALREVRRVLRPGGALHVLEHGLAPDDRVQRWQHRLDPVQRRLFGGCHLSRDVPALLREGGFEVVELRQEYLPGPRVAAPWSFGTLCRAVAPGAS
jgi:ubiquinone/menaquinone biosynthesis C-methylase UbiE